jgi:hypothetical protein
MDEMAEPRGLRGYLAGENDGPGGESTFTADGGCEACVGDLAEEMERAFPGHDWHALAGVERRR